MDTYTSFLPSIGAESAPANFVLQQCKQSMDVMTDGALLGSWRLTFINHRGMPQDRIMLLTEHSILRCNVNFAAGVVNHATRLPMSEIESVVVGPITMPSDVLGKAAKLVGGRKGACIVNSPHAVRVKMKQAFVSSSNPANTRYGFQALLLGPGDKAGLRE